MGKNKKTVQKLGGAGIYCDRKLIGCKDVHWIEERHKFPKAKTKWNVKNLYAAKQNKENFVKLNCSFKF